MTDIRGVQPLRIGTRDRTDDADGVNGIGTDLDLERAQELAHDAELICERWSQKNVGDIAGDSSLTNLFVDDVKSLKDLFGKLAVVADDPTAAAKLNDTLNEYRASLTALLKEVNSPQNAQTLASTMSTNAMHSEIASTQNAGVASDNMASTSTYNTLGLNTASFASTSRSVDATASGFPHLNPSGNPFVWDPSDVFADLPDYINSDNIMAVTLAVFMKLGLAMQGVLALQTKDLSDLGDKIAYLNKVQAAYTEVSDYYANGNPGPGGTGIHTPLTAADINAYFPNLGSLLKQNGWDGSDIASAGAPPAPANSMAAAFNKMNAQANIAASLIDPSVVFQEDPTSHTFGTPNYFIGSGTANVTGLQFPDAGNANSAIKAISNITSQGSSVSQKKTAVIQSTQTNYNNVWAFCSSFIKDLSQSLQAIAQA